MRITRTIINGPEPCPYLSNQLWAMQYAEIAEMEPGDYEPHLLSGWFKFGSFLQKPLCHWCKACRSMRVPLAEWTPSRSHRRVLKRNAGTKVVVNSPPLYSDDRLRLYNRYRSVQRLMRGWGQNEMTVEAYLREFVLGPLPMTEISVWDDNRLLAVIMMDDEPHAMASVTHFYDPSLPRRSLGLFAVLQSFLHAKHLGKTWLYLGYYVPKSPSMAYKEQFYPCELRDWKGEWHRKNSMTPNPIKNVPLQALTS